MSIPGGSMPKGSSTVATPLASLNQMPGWLGTLIASPDGSVLQSAGELVNSRETAQRFANIATRVGRLLALESEFQTSQFVRLLVHFQHCDYIMTCVGNTVYVVKRLADGGEKPVDADLADSEVSGMDEDIPPTEASPIHHQSPIPGSESDDEPEPSQSLS